MPTTLSHKITRRLQQGRASLLNRLHLRRMADQVASHAPDATGHKPVVIFNASARLIGLSQNAAFSLLTAWSLRLSGVPVVHFVCKSGMSHCIQGTNRQDYTTPPPCSGCIAQSQQLYRGAQVRWFSFERDRDLAASLEGLDIGQLSNFIYPLPDGPVDEVSTQENSEDGRHIPLGKLVLPSIRWALRCHHLPDDQPTRYLYREYILNWL
jgi:hypothetical protein